MDEDTSESANTNEVRSGWPIAELWDKYEHIAMHFNDLLMRLRTQALAAIAAIAVIAGVIAKDTSTELRSWELLTLAGC